MVVLLDRLSLRSLLYGTLAFVALAATAIGFTVIQLRNDEIIKVSSNSLKLATVLADQTEYSVQSIDLVLQELQERILLLGVLTPEDPRAKLRNDYGRALLTSRAARLPQADRIFVADATGDAVAISGNDRPRGFNVANRDYFQFNQATPSKSLYVSAPLKNAITGAWSVVFSRQLDSANGDFIGIVAVGVELKTFSHLYKSLDVDAGEMFVLSRNDGMVLINHALPDMAGKKVSATSPWYGVVARGGGNFFSHGRNDGIVQIAATRPLKNYPLVVDVAVSQREALALWRQRATFIALGTLVTVICLVILLSALTRQFHRLFTSEASLSEKSKELEAAKVQADAALNNMSQGLSMFDAKDRLVLCNERYLQMFGLTRDQVPSGAPFEVVMEHRRARGNGMMVGIDAFSRMRKDLRSGKVVRATMTLNDGRIIAVVNRAMPDGGFVATHEDITERKQSEARIAHMARHDSLTDLPNRLFFKEQLDQALAALKEGAGKVCVFIIDLDHFKEVNNSRGHAAGDALLIEVSQRLRDVAEPANAVVARLGGDEFALMQRCDGAEQHDCAAALATSLLATLREPHVIDGYKVVTGASIGMSLAPADGTNAGALLKHADLALYKMKAEGRGGYRLFDKEMDIAARSRIAMQADLRGALEHDEFELYYQPIFGIIDRKPRAMEALVRWQHPKHGLIGPGSFIPLAEENGLIVELGEWVLRKACADAACWPADIAVAVNLSPVQFTGALAGMVTSALAQSGLAPERLELELTETALLDRSYDVIAVMQALRRLGVTFALDDFGVGYSSLANLHMGMFDKIKIDKSFVDGLTTRSESLAIISGVVGLGRALDIIVTAEGVETEEQFTLLKAAGCDEAQGFLLARPAPLSQRPWMMPVAKAS